MTLDASTQTGRRREANPYAELKRLVKEEGLLDRQPAYFGGKIALNSFLLAVGLALLPILDNTWLQLANAVYLAFVFVQISFLAHDFGHRQFSFRAPWKNDWATLILGNLLLGVSRQWWIDKHNDHHGHPNQMDVDPDVDIPLLAFEEEQAFEKRGFARFVVKYQAVLIFPLSLLQSISMLRSSVEFLASKKARRPLTEASLIVAHFALYFGLLFLFLSRCRPCCSSPSTAGCSACSWSRSSRPTTRPCPRWNGTARWISSTARS